MDSVGAATTINPSAYDFTIGGDVPGILEIFYGKIDEVRLYSRALSDDDIAELCDCTTSGVSGTPRLPESAILRTYPNPSGGRSGVEFFLGTRSDVELYDLLKLLGKEGEKKIDRSTASEVATRAHCQRRQARPSHRIF